MNRKKFLSTIGGGTLALTLAPNLLLAENLKFLDQNSDYKLTILHTNDQHSRIEPFDSSYSRNPNQGGFALLKALELVVMRVVVFSLVIKFIFRTKFKHV